MKKAIAALAALVMLATPAAAHVGVGSTSSFMAGLAHPLTGADHMAAMLAVGLWSALAGGPRVWAWPIAFSGAMLVGAVLGFYGVAMPMVEPAIAASVIVLGLLVAAGAAIPVAAGSALVAMFGIAHGHAHGSEGTGATFVAYASGFLISTVGLHLAGIGLGKAIAAQRIWWARGIGLATAAVGVALLIQ